MKWSAQDSSNKTKKKKEHSGPSVSGLDKINEEVFHPKLTNKYPQFGVRKSLLYRVEWGELEESELAQLLVPQVHHKAVL